MFRIVQVSSLLVFLFAPAALRAEKTLHWRAIDVRARLGEGVVVTLRLARRDASRPAAVRSGTTPAIRAGVFAVLLGALLGLSLAWRQREIALGRFESLPPLDSIDEAWLEKNVFSLLPEEVGALWDEKIGALEVTAVLARLTAEKKIEARAAGKKLTMRRLVPIDHFSTSQGPATARRRSPGGSC